MDEKKKAAPETREQSMKKIEYFLPKLTDQELRVVAAFIGGMKKRT